LRTTPKIKAKGEEISHAAITAGDIAEKTAQSISKTKKGKKSPFEALEKPSKLFTGQNSHDVAPLAE